MVGNTLALESLRARVTVRGVILRQKPVAGQPLAADVHVENTGSSEAVNVRVRVRASKRRALPAGEMPQIPFPPNGSAAVLAPQGKMSSDVSLSATDLTAQFVEALLKGSTNLFVFGVVSYDSFGKSHETAFCFMPSPAKIQNAQTCSKWNSTRQTTPRLTVRGEGRID